MARRAEASACRTPVALLVLSPVLRGWPTAQGGTGGRRGATQIFLPEARSNSNAEPGAGLAGVGHDRTTTGTTQGSASAGPSTSMAVQPSFRQKGPWSVTLLLPTAHSCSLVVTVSAMASMPFGSTSKVYASA